MMNAHSRLPALALLFVIGWTTIVNAQFTPPGYRSYPLQHVQSADVAPQLRGVLSNGQQPAEVLVDRNNNRLLIRGADQQHRMAEQVLRSLDRPALNPAPQRTVPQRNVVKPYAVPVGRVEAIARELSRRFPPESGVRIAPNERLNEVIVVAPILVQNEVAKYLESAGGGERSNGPMQLQPSRSAQVAPSAQDYHLDSITWKAFEDHLTQLFGNRVGVNAVGNGEISNVMMPDIAGNQPVLQIDRARNQVHFTGPAEISRAWMQVARALDSAPGAGPRNTQVVPVRRASPATIQQTVAMLQRTPSNADGEATTAALTLGNRREWGGNMLNNIFQQRTSTAQDAQGGSQDQPKSQNPNNANPNNQTPPANQDPNAALAPDDTGLIGDVQIEYIEGLGIFVIRGNKRDVEKVRKIIAEIERQTRENEPQIVVHYLDHVNGRALSELIASLYDQVFGQRQSPVSITALDQPNALLLIGQPDSITSVVNLIKKLDQPISPETSLRVFPLKWAAAVDVERQIRQFFVDQPPNEEVRGGLGTRPRVLADFRTNALIVNASPREMIEIEHLIKSLDRDDAEATNQLRVFHLRNTLATELATVLTEAITTPPPATGAGGGGAAGATQTTFTQKSTVVSLVTRDAMNNQVFESGILADAVFTADTNSNALVVRAPAKSMGLVAELIKQLDTLPDAKAQIKVYTIENGDATSLAQMLQALFGQQVTAGQGAFGAALGQALVQATAAGAGESSLIALRIAVDVRTNSIIVSGGQSDLEVVEALLARLDAGDIETRKLEVFRLKNAFSDDVALAITTFLTSQRTLIQQQLQFSQAVSPFEQIEREVIVVSEPVSNSLIVSATPRYFDQIVKVINDLDYRPPMVMVQVLIAEVRLSDQFEFGAEVGIQDSILFDRGAASIGFPFANAAGLGNDLNVTSQATRELLAGQGLAGFAVGRTNSDLGYGGLVLSAANESINVLVRALQDAGRLQILSRPQIMTLDNQQAFVQVGARVPRITNSNLTQFGVQNTTTDEDVGLLLNVRPRISPDGLVVMEIGAEKSEVGPTSEGIPIAVDQNGNAILSPQINTTTAQTVVSARSGQTIVFAGLITKSKAVTKRGIPWLSNIPVVGNLFGFEQEVEERTELLIIMTPHIVNGEEEGDWLKWIESERMSWCLADVVELHGDVGLSGGHGLWGTADAPTIFPDLDPTGEGARTNPAPVADRVSEPAPARQRRNVLLPRRRVNRESASNAPRGTNGPVLVQPAVQPNQLPAVEDAAAYRYAPQGYVPGGAYAPANAMPSAQRQAQVASRLPQPPLPTQESVTLPTRVSYGPSQMARKQGQYSGDLLTLPNIQYTPRGSLELRSNDNQAVPTQPNGAATQPPANPALIYRR